MSSSSGNLTKEIKSEAQRMGFHLVGVTTPEQPPHWPVFENWLVMGRHGEMTYLAQERARECRADLRKIMPECRSVLVLGVRYPNPDSVIASQQAGPHGTVAAYAWGQDYHIALQDRLRALAAHIDSIAGYKVPSRCYTDTGPLLERDLAQRAGLGWIGKNTCLIHPRLGSYILLAEILLSIDLELNEPFGADRCGKCTRCIQACPTGCILPDRTIDARRCISYLTIELKGSIPQRLRPLLGNAVFGCDACQIVCPWNQHAITIQLSPSEQGINAIMTPNPGISKPDLQQELHLSPEEFARKYKNSPIKRAKRGGYLRNVATVLGNTKNPSVIPALERALEDSEPLVREHASWAINQIHEQTSPATGHQ